MEEPVTKRFPKVARPPVMLPVLREVEKRLVEEAVVANRLVVVALVPVAFKNVKFWSVLELLANNCWKEETAEVDVATIASATIVPETPNRVYGEVVPRPRFPLAVNTEKRFVLVS